jgi:hypothetical protein
MEYSTKKGNFNLLPLFRDNKLVTYMFSRTEFKQKEKKGHPLATIQFFMLAYVWCLSRLQF